MPSKAYTSTQAVQAFMDWLNSRTERSGPFGLYWGSEPGNALVTQFCAEQGWVDAPPAPVEVQTTDTQVDNTSN